MASGERLAIRVDEADPSMIRVTGEIDAHTAPDMEEVFASADASSELSVEMSGVSFVDSTGLRVLVSTHKRLADAGGELVLRSPSRSVMRLLEITGLSGELSVR